ncbi:MAG: RNA polymerase sigma factor [Clostridia bacterium]
MNNPSFGADDPIETIIQRYADLVYKLAYAKTRHPHDAEDIFQEVFCGIFKNSRNSRVQTMRKLGLSG